MHFARFVSLFFCLLVPGLLDGQEKNKFENFTAPLDIPMFLSGNFGELRSTHFHSGIDIKTQQQIGKNVYASKDGYVSRIKIQSGGYGKSVYLFHPEGYTTVYAHLNDFIPEIASYVKDIQYAQRKYEINVFPEKYRIPVVKGQLIGHSGNTGYSGGPHLHYEIRDAYQNPLNVLRFGFNILDNIAPEIKHLAVYPVEPSSIINGRNNKVIYEPVRINGEYILKDTLTASGMAGFGIETYDYLNGSGNRCAVYSIELAVNGLIVYYHEMNKFSFSEVKYLNSHLDYEERILNNLSIHKLFPDPNNKLSIYKTVHNNGIVYFSDDSVYHVRISVKDAYSNSTSLFFKVSGTKSNHAPLQNTTDSSFVKTFYYSQVNTYQTPEIKIVIPEYALFRDIDFKYAALKKDTLPYSDLHVIHSDLTPLCGSYRLSIRTKNMSVNLAKKAFIASVDRKNKLNVFGGTWQNGFVSASVDCFGRFFILVDTMAPSVKPVAFRSNQYCKADDTISFEITDDLSGLKSYNGYIDDEWALFEYDKKSNSLSYTIDKERLTPGIKHALEIVVVDDRNNISVYKSGFYY
ncbi:MAG TPA: M23 family metallopeptidase [Bacteroidales bacterium]|nr:M23 family metallopeptidase [Bacteroidales bacterium]